MGNLLKSNFARILRSVAFRLEPPSPRQTTFVAAKQTFSDLEAEFKKFYDLCIDYTMTGVERLYAQYNAINYIVSANIPGDIVECGAWRGGNSMMAALRLKALGNTERKLYLYDTFAGMSEPEEVDISFSGVSAKQRWEKERVQDNNTWAYAPLEEVQNNLYSTGYPRNNIEFIKGKVEETIPRVMPQNIALLRLDTDWYASTYHELTYLYPLLVRGGVLIIDDYGHWQGARKAVEQYIAENNIHLYLHRIDYTGRAAIKFT